MLSLKPEDEKRLHPAVVERFAEVRASIAREVPLAELTEEDLNSYLRVGEKYEFDGNMKKIGAALADCLAIAADEPAGSIRLQCALFTLRSDLFVPTHVITRLLREVHCRRMQ